MRTTRAGFTLTLCLATLLLPAGGAFGNPRATRTPAHRTQQGKPVTLTFPTPAVTTATTTAEICRTPAALVTKAVLWMPSMGHGSGETTLAPAENGCTRVDDMDFLMAGEWEIRVSFADGDATVFRFGVAD